MSVQKPSEITRVDVASRNRRGVVIDNYCAMHSYGDIIVARKCPRDVLEANVIGRETRRSQNAQSSTQVGARRFVFSRVQLRTKVANPLICYAPGLPQQGIRPLTNIVVTHSREEAVGNKS